MTKSKACPCKGCTEDRHPGCHSDCKKGYQEWHEWWVAKKSDENRIKYEKLTADHFLIEGSKRAKENARRKKPK